MKLSARTKQLDMRKTVSSRVIKKCQHNSRRMINRYIVRHDDCSGMLSMSLLLLVIILSCQFIIQDSHQQSSISLNNAQWFLSNANGSISYPAQVPGGIYSDLRRNNHLKQDILFGRNDLAYRWVGHENWTYTTSFAIDQQIATSQSVKLVLHGVDTVSSILLNGEDIGSTDNMFVRYKFDIKPHLKLAGLKNVLVIRFESPVKYAARKSHASIRQNRGKVIAPYCPSPAQRGECHVNFIRKMQASFSWDWGPAFPSVGIYKDIEIEFGSFGIIRDILVETRRLTPLISANNRPPAPPPQVIISSSIRQQVQVPTVNNRTVPYLRAPPYYLGASGDSDHLFMGQPPLAPSPESVAAGRADESGPAQAILDTPVLEENWLLKTTIVAEMVQPSFGYNVRIEFNLNNMLHYESEHINVVANSDGFIRLGFNLRIDTSRMPIKPWWPNNAGSQTLYHLSARMMPVPNAVSSSSSSPSSGSSPLGHVGPPEHIRIHETSGGGGGGGLPVVGGRSTASSSRRRRDSPHDQQPPSSMPLPPAPLPSNDPREVILNLPVSLQSRTKPLQTPAVAPITFLATPLDASTYQLQHVSQKEIMFGFRTVELIQEPVTRGALDDGLTFNFRINGMDLFAMGSNWIPASVLPENSNDLDYIRYLLQSAKDANMNMLRVWGGGIYESDEFYQMADEMGIMIWHDFMFACALYPAEDDFLNSVRQEIEQQVQRLQHHPSIVLWAGNNENEMAIAGPWWPEVMVWNKKLRESYFKLYVETIKPIVQVLDPTRPYVESSPSNGLASQSQPFTIARTPNENKYGDVHHYDYLADSFEWSNYPSTRFASEYGFQSYPSFNSLASVTLPNDWKYPLTANILHRQHRLTGETEMKLQIKMHFGELKPGALDKFKTFLYLSQLTQAIAIKTETEFYRRNRFIDPDTKLGKTMGALYWQLNDVWSAPTWSSIEFGGKWKMLHYFARRFFFPIQIIPYLVQPPPLSSPLSTLSSSISSATVIQQMLASSGPISGPSTDPLIAQQHQQQQQPQPQNSQLFVVDLVRDDVLQSLDSFNVTIRFYRWTSFTPVWQDTVYVRNTRPHNVTRIYEQDIMRIVRHPGVISLSSGVFQVVIEQQQARFGLSQIENYLMPVAPNRVTAMRVAKINAELVQGPFELSEVRSSARSQQNDRVRPQAHPSVSQWSCAYRLTLVSDSIAMFVWLDLNLLNVGSQQQQQNDNEDPMYDHRPQRPPNHIQLDTLPLRTPFDHRHNQPTADHIRPHPDGAHHFANRSSSDDMLFDASARDEITGGRLKRQATFEQPMNEWIRPMRDGFSSRGPHLSGPSLMQHEAHREGLPIRYRNNQYSKANKFKPIDSSGSNMLRYQFSDNAFNMFEPSKVIDLYLSRCLSRAQIEVALEIQSLADSL